MVSKREGIRVESNEGTYLRYLRQPLEVVGDAVGDICRLSHDFPLSGIQKQMIVHRQLSVSL